MLIDLSMPVNEKTIVFPGDALPKFEQAGNLSNDGFIDHVIHVNNHLGTHIDAPGHMVEGGAYLHEYPIDRFRVPAVCIDARGKEQLTADILDGQKIEAGVAVLILTGFGDRYTSQEYTESYPVFDVSLATALVEKKVSMVGVDMISFDHDAPFPAHVELLKNDVLLIENLINLDQVAGKTFTIYALPINFELEAAPARVIAELN